ncbi:receptor-type guanylate cyclase gcy-28-like isoform X1 [Gordionus sp. m RMFG-2023]|uniref:receptor-type guanylate cyclase gcy-28-like isoform X1 n=1 Tax=Gordionus sp. m RMFG-2023 TaxID=3053472 RepID=UPI0031FC63CC
MWKYKSVLFLCLIGFKDLNEIDGARDDAENNIIPYDDDLGGPNNAWWHRNVDATSNKSMSMTQDMLEEALEFQRQYKNYMKRAKKGRRKYYKYANLNRQQNNVEIKVTSDNKSNVYNTSLNEKYLEADYEAFLVKEQEDILGPKMSYMLNSNSHHLNASNLSNNLTTRSFGDSLTGFNNKLLDENRTHGLAIYSHNSSNKHNNILEGNDASSITYPVEVNEKKKSILLQSTIIPNVAKNLFKLSTIIKTSPENCGQTKAGMMNKKFENAVTSLRMSTKSTQLNNNSYIMGPLDYNLTSYFSNFPSLIIAATNRDNFLPSTSSFNYPSYNTLSVLFNVLLENQTIFTNITNNLVVLNKLFSKFATNVTTMITPATVFKALYTTHGNKTFEMFIKNLRSNIDFAINPNSVNESYSIICQNCTNIGISKKKSEITSKSTMLIKDVNTKMAMSDITKHITIVHWGLLLNNNSNSLSSLSRIAPAIQVALKRQQIQSLLILPKYNKLNILPKREGNGIPKASTSFLSATNQSSLSSHLKIIQEDKEQEGENVLRVVVKQGDSQCSFVYGFTEAIRLAFNENIVVLFGPVCDLAASKFARLTGRLFNIPMISAGTLTHDFGKNKTLPDSEFPLLTRVGPSFNSMAKVIVKILIQFDWNRVAILHETNSHPEVMDRYCYYASTGILNELIDRNGKLGNDSSKEPEAMKITYKQALNMREAISGQISWTEFLTQSVGYEYSVIILCASQATVRKILLAAYDLNMVQSGEYVFFNIELFNKPDHKNPIWEVEKDGTEINAKAKIAYEALFTLTMRMPDNEEYRKFSGQVKEISKRVYGFDYGTENVNAFVSAFHDAVILYALALNETLQAGFNYTDGVEITRRMWNRTFTGITGNVSIDANGDRYTDYSLWDLNPNTGRFQVVLNYYGKENSLLEVPGKAIHWAGGRSTPPLDQPECGYDGSLCRKKEFPKYAIVITFLGSLVCLLSILSFFIYRRYRLEAELGAMKWKIAWEDLMFQSLLQSSDNKKFHSKYSLSRFSLDNNKQDSEYRRNYDSNSSNSLASDDIIEESGGGSDDHQKHRQGPLDYMRKRRKYHKKKSRHKSKVENQYFNEHKISNKISKISKAASIEFIGHNHKKSSDSNWYGEFGKITKDNWIGKVMIAYYKSVPVILKPVISKKKIEITRPMLLEIKQRKDLQNDYITRFVGACLDNTNPLHNCLVTEYCQKGSLRDILENGRLQLDWMFRYSLMHDLTKGMSFLHNSEIKSHGNLKSTNCLVDSRFVLKITDFGLHILRPNYDNFFKGEPEYYERKLWTAPELLRLSEPPPAGTQKGDVYSFAIIMQEIGLRKGTFYIGENKISAKDIILKVKAGYNLNSSNHYFRPTLAGADCDEEVIKLIEKCWSEDPIDRMDFNAIRLIIRKINKENESDNILDNLLSRMEHYANNLENLVEERTADYLEQKRKAEEVLYQLLPRSVAGQLIKGESVTAESFDSVTIYFSDIVGFTSLSASSTPMQVVDLLNDLYTCFDSTIGNYDVYKVETIGDAYMVVSGLPRRINEHAREISAMALALQKAAKSFTIRHRPFEQLILRIGVHSGPCVAGVVGLKMPRYCLFGDTVNTASRMESTGKPNMIHMSSFTRDLIEPSGIFDLELRGDIDVKGKGKITTYWLLGYKTDKSDKMDKKTDLNDKDITNKKDIENFQENKISPHASHLFRSEYEILENQNNSIPLYNSEKIPEECSDAEQLNDDSNLKRNKIISNRQENNCKSMYATPPTSPIFMKKFDLDNAPTDDKRSETYMQVEDKNDIPSSYSAIPASNDSQSHEQPDDSIIIKFLPIKLPPHQNNRSDNSGNFFSNAARNFFGSTMSLLSNLHSPTSLAPSLFKNNGHSGHFSFQNLDSKPMSRYLTVSKQNSSIALEDNPKNAPFNIIHRTSKKGTKDLQTKPLTTISDDYNLDRLAVRHRKNAFSRMQHRKLRYSKISSEMPKHSGSLASDLLISGTEEDRFRLRNKKNDQQSIYEKDKNQIEVSEVGTELKPLLNA